MAFPRLAAGALPLRPGGVVLVGWATTVGRGLLRGDSAVLHGVLALMAAASGDVAALPAGRRKKRKREGEGGPGSQLR